MFKTSEIIHQSFIQMHRCLLSFCLFQIQRFWHETWARIGFGRIKSTKMSTTKNWTCKFWTVWHFLETQIRIRLDSSKHLDRHPTSLCCDKYRFLGGGWSNYGKFYTPYIKSVLNLATMLEKKYCLSRQILQWTKRKGLTLNDGVPNFRGHQVSRKNMEINVGHKFR
jgi:hypothetical protein